MSQIGARQPPRFVPTLTDVVSVQEDRASSDVQAEAGELAGTDASQSAGQEVTSVQPEGHNVHTIEDWSLAAQSIQTRVMERLDATLEEHLRYALADVVQMHSQSLYQALRQDVERVVNAAVHEAVVQELAQMRKPDAP